MPKKSIEQQLARRLAIIGILPQLPQSGAGQGMTIDRLMARLGTDFDVDRRTFERDLKDLSDPGGDWRRFGLEVISRVSAGDARITEWFTTSSSKIPLFKSVTPADALVASFARQELGPFLPREARQSLDEQLATIEQKLRHLQHTTEHRQGVAYKDKIRRLPDGTPMAPSKVNPAHLQIVNDALMKNLMLKLVYRAAKADELKHHVVYPIGLLIHDRSLRLLAIDESELAMLPSAMTIKSFLLHRMQKVALADAPPRNIKVPTLDQAIANGALTMWPKGRIALHVRFADSEDAFVFARTLDEMPLAGDQNIYRNSAGQLELTATVTNTSPLRRMLQSMAREVKVLAPEELKRDIRKFLADGLAFQRDD
jgi:predicted DNA-binding transcriptional regulator YafY